MLSCPLGNKVPVVVVDSGGSTIGDWNLRYVPFLSYGNGWRAETDRPDRYASIWSTDDTNLVLQT